MSKLPLVAAGSGVAALLLCVPASLSGAQSLLQQTDNHPLLLLGMRALLNCSFGALFGSSAWVLLVGNPLLRKHLNRKQLSESLFVVCLLILQFKLKCLTERRASHKWPLVGVW